MDIYSLIHTDHRKAKEAIAAIKALPDERYAERIKLFRPLKADLILHNESEEESFYAMLRQNSRTSEDAERSAKEHHEVDAMLDDLDVGDLTPEEWRLKFDAVCAALMDHIAKEEGRVFEKARAVLSERTAVELAQKMELIKKEKQDLVQKAS